MLVPSFLFGNARAVRANVKKVLTRLRRGATLEEICEESNQIDLADHPGSLVWLDSTRVLREADAQDCRAILLTNGLFDSASIPFEQSNAIRERSVDYLSRTPWGTVVLNSGQAGVWYTALPLRPLRPCRAAYVAIVRGTLEHWAALTGLGHRYYSGGYGAKAFSETLPAYGGVLAHCGLEPRTGNVAWQDIRLLADASLVQRLEFDDPFWNGLVRKMRSEFGTPELVPDNLAEITGLCESGSWDAEQWEFLRAQSGAEGLERALDTLAKAGKWSALLGVFVHALHDLERATKLYLEHEGTCPALHWADDLVARHLATRDATRAAAILFQVAERQLVRGKKNSYAASVATLKEAKAVLLGADQAAAWKAGLDRFAAANRRRAVLMTLLNEAFPIES